MSGSARLPAAGRLALERLAQAGCRPTPQRRAVLEALAQSDHPTAEELYRSLRGKKVGLATVYRTLRLLGRLGLVRQVRVRDGRVRYELVGESHCHFVCLACGRVFDADSPEVRAGGFRREGFVVTDSELCLFGYCASCSQKEGGSGEWSTGVRAGKGVQAARVVVP